ncbi:MAG TPA: phosphate ABC transporter permease PstA [Polyangiaceae bacterium]|jgi:phosphate transport system permease protein
MEREIVLNARRGLTTERLIIRGLGAGALVLGGSYLFGLLFLLFRGGLRVVSFTTYATPLEGIDGEERMRFFVAAAFFAAVAWAVSSVAKRFVPALEARPARNASRAFIAAAALVGALFARDHLPRFLIGLPSETRAGGGIGPEIFNTLYFAVLSTAVTLPVGVGAAVYIARFARSRPFVSTLRMALDTLASLPSIVYGLFGFLVFVVEMKAGYSLIAGAFVLALVNLPLVVGVAEEAIRSVPRELEDGSLALGATQVQTVLKVTLPYAWPGILSALVLSIGRVFAESAPLIMTAGTTISRSTAYSLDPFRGGETLAVHLWYVNSAGLSPDKAEISAGTAAVLVILVGLTNVVAARLGRLAGGQAGKRMGRATK